MKHTKGPWKMTMGTKTCAVKQEGSLGYLCEMSDYDRGEQVANAQLIAAAPDMLEALQEIMVIAIHLRNQGALAELDAGAFVERASIAIRKAKGD